MTTHTSSKKESISARYAKHLANPPQGGTVELMLGIKRLINAELTQALKELKEEVATYLEPHSMDDEKVVPIRAIDNKIRELEEL